MYVIATAAVTLLPTAAAETLIPFSGTSDRGITATTAEALLIAAAAEDSLDPPVGPGVRDMPVAVASGVSVSNAGVLILTAVAFAAVLAVV